MPIKLKTTEDFLWKLQEFLEALNDTHKTLAPRSLNDVLRPEWRKLRLTYEKRRRRRSFSQFVTYLKQSGYIRIPTGESIDACQLTEKGRKKALKGRAKGRTLQPRKDGKMIMLMYDIPKGKEKVRKVFRDALKFLDYRMLQKSVWVSDKEVLEETEHAVQEYNLHPHVNIFIIEKIRVQK